MRFSLSIVMGVGAAKCMRAQSPVARERADSDYVVLKRGEYELPSDLEFRRTRQLRGRFEELDLKMADDLSRAAFRLDVTGRAGTGQRPLTSLRDQAVEMGFFPRESSNWQVLEASEEKVSADELFPLINSLWQTRRRQFFHFPSVIVNTVKPAEAAAAESSGAAELQVQQAELMPGALPRELTPDDFELIYSREGMEVSYKRMLTEDLYGDRVWSWNGWGRRRLIAHKGEMVDEPCHLDRGIYLRLKRPLAGNPQGSLLCLPFAKLASLTKKNRGCSESVPDALARLANVRYRCAHSLINPRAMGAFDRHAVLPNLSEQVSRALWEFDIDPERTGGAFYRDRLRVDDETVELSGVAALPIFSKMNGRVVVDADDRVVRRLDVSPARSAKKTKYSEITQGERALGYRVRKIQDKDDSLMGRKSYAGWFEFDALTPEYPKGVDDVVVKNYMRFEALALVNHAIYQKLNHARYALELLKDYSEKAAISKITLEAGKRLSELRVQFSHSANTNALKIWQLHTGGTLVDWERSSAVDLMDVLQQQVLEPMQQARVWHDQLYGGVGGSGCYQSWDIPCRVQAKLGIDQTIAGIMSAADEVRTRLNALAGREPAVEAALSPQAIQAHREMKLREQAKAMVVQQRQEDKRRPADPDVARARPQARGAVRVPVRVVVPVTTIAFDAVSNTNVFAALAVPTTAQIEVGTPEVQQAKLAFFATQAYLKLVDRIRALQAEYTQYFDEDGQRRGNTSVKRANYALLGRAKAQVLLQQLHKIASAETKGGLKSCLGSLEDLEHLRTVCYQLRLLQDDGTYGRGEVVVNLAAHRHATLQGRYHSSNGFFRGFKRVPKTTRYLQDALSVLSDKVNQMELDAAPAPGVQ